MKHETASEPLKVFVGKQEHGNGKAHFAALDVKFKHAVNPEEI